MKIATSFLFGAHNLHTTYKNALHKICKAFLNLFCRLIDLNSLTHGQLKVFP